MTSSERAKKWRADMASKGMCTRCGEPASEGRRTCNTCNAVLLARHQVDYANRVSSGSCVRAGCDNEREPGYRRCTRHLEQDREYKSKYEKAKGKPKSRVRCSVCRERGHNRLTCPLEASMHCECGADKNPRDVACASCVQLDFWRGKPVLELLHERGPTDVYDIAARLDKNPNTVTKYLRGQEKRGHVEASREDRRTIWRLVA